MDFWVVESEKLYHHVLCWRLERDGQTQTDYTEDMLVLTS